MATDKTTTLQAAEVRAPVERLAVRGTSISARPSAWRRSGGGQGDGERIAADHHHQDQPPDRSLAAGVGADELKILVLAMHDESIMESLCSKLVWLDHGEIREVGSFKDIYPKYLAATA